MAPIDIPPITPELWLANLIDVLGEIANKQRQEERWLAMDALAWENPNELICSLFDDCVFDGFLAEFGSTFSAEQRSASFRLRGALDDFSNATPRVLDASEVLADPRWVNVRDQARAFISIFKDQWPSRIS
jgi:hypothetical protein